jgi:hypothetical protein
MFLIDIELDLQKLGTFLEDKEPLKLKLAKILLVKVFDTIKNQIKLHLKLALKVQILLKGADWITPLGLFAWAKMK